METVLLYLGVFGLNKRGSSSKYLIWHISYWNFWCDTVLFKQWMFKRCSKQINKTLFRSRSFAELLSMFHWCASDIDTERRHTVMIWIDPAVYIFTCPADVPTHTVSAMGSFLVDSFVMNICIQCHQLKVGASPPTLSSTYLSVINTEWRVCHFYYLFICFLLHSIIYLFIYLFISTAFKIHSRATVPRADTGSIN